MEADGEDTELPGQETDAGVGVAVEVAGEVAEDFDLLGGDGGATDEGEGGETDVPEAEELGRGEVARGVGEGVCGGDGGGAEVASGKKGGKGSGWGWLRGPEGGREGLGGERVEVLGVAEVGEVAGDGRVWVLGRHRRGGGDGGRRAERGRGRGGRGRGRHERVVGRGAEGRAAAVSGGGGCVAGLGGAGLTSRRNLAGPWCGGGERQLDAVRSDNRPSGSAHSTCSGVQRTSSLVCGGDIPRVAFLNGVRRGGGHWAEGGREGEDGRGRRAGERERARRACQGLLSLLSLLSLQPRRPGNRTTPAPISPATSPRTLPRHSLTAHNGPQAPPRWHPLPRPPPC